MFLAGYYSQDANEVKKLKNRVTKERFLSPIVIHEIYQLTLKKEVRETAKFRTSILEQDYKVVNVDGNLAKTSAELRLKYGMSMADSIIAVTALALKATCVSDDSHFKAVKEIKTEWI